ncbi:MAG: tetratricopeptide repeat protein [Pyrinomonadaceae bacterium]|nr:tetratricopeptide repeat protein [Pyrinomonadaceae bacterium]
MLRLLKISLLIAVTLSCWIWQGAASRAQAQESSATAQETRARGIEMYKRGDIEGAIKTLRAAVKQDKEDAEGWYYLGRSHAAANKIKDARQAFEKAVTLRPNFTDARAALAYMLLLEKKDDEAVREAEIVLKTDERQAEAHYVLGEARLTDDKGQFALAEAEKALAVNPDFDPALLLKAKAVRRIISHGYPTATKEQIDDFIAKSKETVAAMDSLLKRNPNPADAESWREVLFVLRPYAEGNFEAFVYRPADVTQKARILSKPSPSGAFVNKPNPGLVVIQAVFHRDGTVVNIRVVSAHDDEIARICIEAARKIKFTPAMKDGRAVSQHIKIEYHFISNFG